MNKIIYSLRNFQLTLIVTALLLLLTPLAKATEIAQADPNNSGNSPLLVAQKKVCPSSNLLPKRSFETTKYSVYICRGDRANSLGYYVRITKTDGGYLTLPVSQTNGETYIATKNEVAHVITPYEFIVTKQGRIILKERVKSAINGDGQSLTKGCPDDQRPLVEAETTNFIIYICGRDVPRSYVSVIKNGSGAIALPLHNYNTQGKPENYQYLAVNGDVRYILTRKVLRVTQGGRTIVKEKVTTWN